MWRIPELRMNKGEKKLLFSMRIDYIIPLNEQLPQNRNICTLLSGTSSIKVWKPARLAFLILMAVQLQQICNKGLKKNRS